MFKPLSFSAWYLLIIPLALLALYPLLIWPWMMQWGATPAELSMPLPGDELTPVASYVSTRAVTIKAPPAVVWQWLVQVGQDRAGFYSHDWLENVFLAGIHNGNRINPAWQSLAAGDLVRGAQPDYLGGALGADLGWHPPLVEPGHVLYLWGPLYLQALDENHTRLIARSPMGPLSPVMQGMMHLTYDPIHFVMERGMLLGIQARAEGRAAAPLYLTVISGLGWFLACCALVFALLRSRAGRWLLLITLLPFLTVMNATGDLNAAVAVGLAVGLPAAGFAHFGLRWIPWMALIACIVLLGLLLVPDSFAFFGLIFFACLLAGGAYYLLRQRPTRD